MLRLHFLRNLLDIPVIKMSKKNAGRFNGLTEEEVKKKDALPDYLESNLDVVFLGINPSLMAAHTGRYYAGPGNHFYKLLHASNLVTNYVPYQEDCRLLEYKIGLTNIVARPTRTSSDLSAKEIKDGCAVVAEKMNKFKPKIAVFNGKCIYQVFAQHFFNKTQFHFGLQPEKLGETFVWVVPSSSARCSSFPRMENKLPFFLAIKKQLQFIKGEISDVDFKEFVFKDASKPKKAAPEYVITEIIGGTKLSKEAGDENGSESCPSDETNGTSSQFFSQSDANGADEEDSTDSQTKEAENEVAESVPDEDQVDNTTDPARENVLEKENKVTRSKLKAFSPKKLEKSRQDKPKLKSFSPIKLEKTGQSKHSLKRSHVTVTMIQNDEPKPKKKLNFSNLRMKQ